VILSSIPLSLYVHFPWCEAKCPYCDFNSHGLKAALPETEYIEHLLDDLSQDALHIGERSIQSIFIGGGTPSLISAQGITRLIQGIQARVPVMPNAEITLEANPCSVEADKFALFQQAGVNRLSIGVQSFSKQKLQALGRVHNEEQAYRAIDLAKRIPLNSFNIDLMHGLPDQQLAQGLDDLYQAVVHQPPHISWYQLTIEANTAFHSQPPTLPEEDTLWDIQEQGHAYLMQQGYVQYEISAYAKPEFECLHNLNYWQFGDYLGIGCGAHGKITDETGVWRTVKTKHPKGYMDLTRSYLYQKQRVAEQALPFEYFLNRLRLLAPCPKAEYPQLTGYHLPDAVINSLDTASENGLLLQDAQSWQLTEKGKRYLNSLLETLC
jgi:oxygen-independent coproporphyrinogen-3 oxidase